MDNLGFRRAMADAQRIGIVADFHEIAIDTLALDLADVALTSASTDHSLSGLYLAYRGHHRVPAGERDEAVPRRPVGRLVRQRGTDLGDGALARVSAF